MGVPTITVDLFEPHIDWLVAHHSFEGNVNDESNSGLDGAWYGVDSHRQSKIGQVEPFNGEDSYISLIKSEVLPEHYIEQSKSFSFWVESADLSLTKTMLSTYFQDGSVGSDAIYLFWISFLLLMISRRTGPKNNISTKTK